MMNICKNYKVIFMTLLITLILISACSNNNQDDYLKSMYQFYDLYFTIASNIETNNAISTLELLRKEDNQENLKEMGDILDEMGDILDDMKGSKPKNKTHNYEKLTKWYNELVDMSNDKYKDWWGVTLDERREATNITFEISLRLGDWEDKDSDTAWEW